jgi:type II secretory pathway component PulF
MGETSGTLEAAFEQISDETGARMIAKLNILQPVLVRIVMVGVYGAIIIAMLSLVRSS